MWRNNWVIVLAFVAALASAQDQAEEDSNGGPSAQEVVGVRKLRLRRPRPISIDNEDGIAQGNPVPLRAGVPVNQLINTADLLAAAVQEPQPDALQSLLAAAEGSGLEDETQPILPLRPQVDQPRRERPGGRRRVPGVPRRSRPRPAQAASPASNQVAGSGRTREEGGNGRPRPEPIKTTERYSHMNADGSFTFGYVSEDGSFREETRGLDCITRGKYGYIDPDGKRREFTYVSGLPCDNDNEQEFDDQGFEIGDDSNAVREDPIDPADRFRQANAVQLSDDEIPDSARRPIQRRPVQRRPQPAQPQRRPQPAQPQRQPQQSFANFNQATRQPRPRARPTAAAPRPALGGNALQNLLNIADGAAAPQPTPTAVVTRPRPTPTRPRPTAGARPAFDFDSEVDSFTLNRPALTFQGNQEKPRTQNGAPAPANQAVGPNFSSELVFDPATGTFKTELRQTIAGGGEIKIADSAQPGARPRPIQPTVAAFSPTPRPTTPRAPIAIASTTRRPALTAGPLAFQPLSFPNPASVAAQRPASPLPSSPAPTPFPTTPFRAPTPTVPVSPVTSARPPTTPARLPTSPANSFFFQPFPTIGSPRPVAPGQAATPRPPIRLPAGTFALNPFAAQPRPAAPQNPFAAQPRPAAPQVPQPPQVPGFPRPTPVTQPRPVVTPFGAPAAAPTGASATAAPPQIQFGFQPLPPSNARPVGSVQPVARPPQAQAGRAVPFTAFRNGLPQQLNGQGRPVGQPRPVFQQPFQPRPGGAFTAFAPRPQQPQARPPPGFAVRPPPQGLQQRPEQFRNAGPPPGSRFQGRPAAPPAGFSVFNPASLRGARF